MKRIWQTLSKIFKALFIRLPKSLMRVLVTVISLFLFVVIAANVALWGGVFWLNTQSGNAWIEAQLADALADSGYTAKFDKLAYDFPSGIALENLSVSEEGADIVQIDRAELRFGVFALAARIAVLDARIGTLRIPENDKPEEPGILKIGTFSLDDLPVKQINLERLDIERLELAGQDLVLSPRLRASLDFSDGNITADLNLALDNPPQYWPQEAQGQLVIEPQAQIWRSEKLSFTHPDYTLDVSGAFVTTTEGAVALDLAGRVDNLALLSLPGDGGVDVKGRIDGSQTKLAANLEAVIEGDILKDRQLAPVTLRFAAENALENLDGHAELTTRYQDYDISVAADVGYADDVVSLNKLMAEMPDAKLEGDVQILTDQPQPAVNGQLALKIAKLETYQALLGYEVTGAVSADVTLAYADGKQGAEIKADGEALSYQDITAERLSFEAALEDIEYFLAGAKSLQAKNLRMPGIEVAALDAQLSPADGGAFLLKLNGEGRAQALENRALKIGGQAVLPNPFTPVIEARDIAFSLDVGGHQLELSGALSPQNVDLTAQAKNMPLSLVTGEREGPFSGLTVSGEARMQGAPDAPIATVDLDFSPLSVAAAAPEITLQVKARYENEKLGADVSGKGEGIRTLQGRAELPLKISLMPFVFEMADNAALSGSGQAQADMAALGRALLSPDHLVSGALDAEVTLSGTIAQPAIKGGAQLGQATYEYIPAGLSLQDIEIATQFDDKAVRIERLSAKDGRGGTLTGGGALDLSGAGRSEVDLSLENFSFAYGETARGQLSAKASLTGDAKAYTLSGSIHPDQLDIQIPERFSGAIPELNIVKQDKAMAVETPVPLNLDLTFDAPSRIFVRGWGLDAELGGTLQITGTAEAPLVNGNLSAVRGRYEEFGKRFNIARADLRFQGAVPPSPFLDVLAETQVEDITAQVAITGPVEKPSIKLSSVPGLPEDEVLSRILFGSDLSDITPFQAVQLTQTLRRFSGQGGSGFDPLGALRETTGLDDLRVDSTDEGAEVGLGKYLTDNVYFELERGAGENSGAANIQVEVTPNIKVESKVGQDAQGGAGIFWEWDY